LSRLEQRGADVQITPQVLEAAAGNEECGEAVMTSLQQETGDGFASLIDESTWVAAATCGQHKVLDLLSHLFGSVALTSQWLAIADLYTAAKLGDLESAQQLLSSATPPDFKNIRSVTPLWIAAFHGHEAIVKLLVQNADVDVNSLSISGRSPLFWPSDSGNDAIVSILLDAGAKSDYRDENGESPASVAKKRGHTRILELLDCSDPSSHMRTVV
jgi:hypothetical protein